MRDVERCHDGDALRTDHFSAVPDFAHFFIEISNCLQQFFAFVVRAGDAEFASHDADIHGVAGFHSSLSGSLCQ